MSPQGKVLTQGIANRLKDEEHLIILCGHYEGVDERVIEEIVDEEISIGDYVLTGGELPAMVLIDCISRLIDGVLSSEESYLNESHYNGLLEFPITQGRLNIKEKGSRYTSFRASCKHRKVALFNDA